MHVVLLATNPADSHGWSRYAHDVIRALAAQEVAVTLLTAHDVDPQRLADLPLRAIYPILPSLTPTPRFSSLRLLAALPAVRRILAQTASDAVHAAAEPYALALLGSRIRRVITAHGTYIPQTVVRRGFGTLYRRAYRHAHIACVSSYTERQVQAALPGSQTHIILNGVNPTRFALPGLPPDKRGPTILCTGQLKPRKGTHLLIEAMRRVREAIPDAQAVILGDTSADPAYVESLRAQIVQLSLTECVHLMGRVAEDVLIGWYHAADVFALPAFNIGGRFEGFGLVYLEAGAAGLPVIGTRDCGAEDAIREGETGLLVPQDDPSALADAILRLLRDPALSREMGETGRQFAARQTWAQTAARLKALYRL